MGETVKFNPNEKGYDVRELAEDPIGASDEVQKLMRAGKYEDAQELLDAVVNAQQGRGGRKEEPRQAMAA